MESAYNTYKMRIFQFGFRKSLDFIARFGPSNGEAIRIECFGTSFRVRDWSLSGFDLVVPIENARVRDRVRGRIRIGRFARWGDFTAEVVRISRNGNVRMRFVEVPARTFVAMSMVRSH